ncbi:DUF3313 family protein [Amphritea sp. HPY]|uniref:DUF3313 family protein n=1 Tax=Amphritea sp. HPY TaxID=3421652 RepID=UPI003D7E4E3E
MNSGQMLKYSGCLPYLLLGLLLLPYGVVADERRFLTSYDEFVPHPEIKNAQYWLKPGVSFQDIAAYNNFLLLPIQVLYARDEQHNAISPDKVKTVTDYFRVSLETSLAPEYRLVDSPAAGVAVIRAALSGVRQSNEMQLEGGQIPVEVLLSDLNDTPEMAAAKAVHIITAVLELEIYDAVSGERLFALIDQQSEQEPGLAAEQRSFEAIKVVLDNWSARFRKGLGKHR